MMQSFLLLGLENDSPSRGRKLLGVGIGIVPITGLENDSPSRGRKLFEYDDENNRVPTLKFRK